MAKKAVKTGKSSNIVLEISDGITISNVNEIKKKVINYFKENNNLVLKLKQTEQLDLAGIQFLYSLQKSCVRQKKKIVLDINLTDETMELLYNSGFKNLLTINVP